LYQEKKGKYHETRRMGTKITQRTVMGKVKSREDKEKRKMEPTMPLGRSPFVTIEGGGI